jgi:KUP system potassium uptake protein
MLEKPSQAKGILRSLGLVFGDIGTSPIYTIAVVFVVLKPTYDNILGVLSLIVWTLVLLPTVQYAWMAMNLSKRGEGGTIVLREILISHLKSKRNIALVSILSFIGVSLVMGDGVITPAISILSAVEGAVLIPGMAGLSRTAIVLISIAIAVGLFSFQSRGTEKVAGFFGPIMVIWFSSLILVGVLAIAQAPAVLWAINPYYGMRFLLHHRLKGILALAEIILCATGGEAIYADMGHLGSRPIRQSWGIVFVALVLNYLGQGAFLLMYPEAKNVLFEMIFHYANLLYVPFLLLSIAATIIASQAIISGMFSIVYQGITTRVMPMFKVDYTSVERKSQIYIGSVNWFLLGAVIIIMLVFGSSHSLAGAYGLAVTGTMTITGLMMIWISYLKKKPLLVAVSILVAVVDMTYLGANLTKIPHGGYWSLILASIPLATILLYTQGQKKLYRTMDFMPLDDFLLKFNRIYATSKKITGSVLFLIKDIKEIPFYITQTMFYHGILYEDNILVSIIMRDDPFGITGFFKEDLAKGLRVFEIQAGYMEVIEVEEILKEAGIDERVVFYGLEDISTRNPVWEAFATIKRVTPSFIKFYNFPPRKLHGVLTKIGL